MEAELERGRIGREPEIVLRRVAELGVGFDAVLFDAEGALGVEMLLAPAGLGGIEIEICCRRHKTEAPPVAASGVSWPPVSHVRKAASDRRCATR